MNADTVKRWAPIVGTVILAVSTLLRLLGQQAIADTIDTVGKLTHLTDSSVIDAAVITQAAGAVVAVLGVVLKIVNQVKNRKTNG